MCEAQNQECLQFPQALESLTGIEEVKDQVTVSAFIKQGKLLLSPRSEHACITELLTVDACRLRRLHNLKNLFIDLSHFKHVTYQNLVLQNKKSRS